MLKSFIKFYKPYKKLFFLDLLVATIASVCELIYPMLTRTLINETIPNRNIRTIGVFAVTLILLYVIKAACTYFMQYWGHVVGASSVLIDGHKSGVLSGSATKSSFINCHVSNSVVDVNCTYASSRDRLKWKDRL